MKKKLFNTILPALGLIVLTQSLWAQTAAYNYVRVRTPRTPLTTTSQVDADMANKTLVETTIQYVDGLGRPLQTIQMQGSPAGNDVIQPFGYDGESRDSVNYLPYTVNSTSPGAYQPTAIVGTGGTYTTSAQYQFYQQTGRGYVNTQYPYAGTGYEPSAINRPAEQGAPGASWQLSTSGVTGSGHTVKTVYTINNATSFAADSINGRQVAWYNATINPSGSRSLVPNGYYAPGTLTVTVMKDENWTTGRAGTFEEYKDLEGHVVLKRVYNYTASAVQVLSTYYVYDDFGLLAFVLPPAMLADIPTSFTYAQLSNLGYQYRYDDHGRMLGKKIPGKGWDFIAYNYIDQPVATQDSLQSVSNNWIVTKYDAMGRTVENGIWNNNNTAITQASLQTSLTAITTNLWETPVTTGNGYTNAAWPTAYVTTTLDLSYYDAYTGIPGLPATYHLTTGVSKMTRGLLTVKKTAVLNTPANMLWDAVYYDDLGRTTNTYAQHYLGGVLNTGNYDAVTTTYNFNNQPTTSTRTHWNTGSATTAALTIYNKYTYDHVGRKLNSWEKLTNGGNTPDVMRLVSAASYNELGQLQYKNLHSTDSVNYLQTITYAYNERGWLLSSSAPLFAMTLYYNTSANKEYNGNIMYQYWGTPGSLTNHYSYLYDRLNRLLSGSANTGNNESVSYDMMGNITTLNRKQTTALTLIDGLSYSYGGTNQLQSVNDGSGNNTGMQSGITAYTYDGNGNMLSAANTVNSANNKSFTYNLLNLPLVATIPSGTATYTYDAGGGKLRKVDYTTANSNYTYTDYIAGIQYAGSTANPEAIDRIQTEEGYAVPLSTGAFDYYYQLGDNLGNTRITFDTQSGTATTRQQDDYYPFGLEINTIAANPKNEYLYNKKELQEEFAEYDYGARFYDPVIGRWTSIDPLAEKYKSFSPYNYGENNPIKNIDLEGDSIIEVGKGIQHDKVFNDGMATMRRTFMGGQEYDKYANSSSTDLYVSHGTGTDEGGATLANLRDHDEVTSDNHMDLGGDAAMSNLDGVSVKGGVQVDAMEVNSKQESKLDKYDMAMVIYHEMRAHMDNNKGSGEQQHQKFGNFAVIPGLALHGEEGLEIYKPGSDAYNFLRQLLTIKIQDGNGTEQNKKDLQEMVSYMQNEQKKKTNGGK